MLVKKLESVVEERVEMEILEVEKRLMSMMHSFVDDKIGKVLDENKGKPIIRENVGYTSRMSSPCPHLNFNTPVEIG